MSRIRTHTSGRRRGDRYPIARRRDVHRHPDKHKETSETDEELIKMVGPGANRPGAYITSRQRYAADELRKRGYRVSLKWGTVTKNGKKIELSLFSKPRDKAEDMAHDGWTYEEAIPWIRKAFPEMTSRELQETRKAFMKVEG